MQSTDSFSVPLHKVEGRLIRYHIGDNNGNVGEDDDPRSFTFNGTSLEELLERLQEEMGLEDIIMCSRSPINGKLLPLRLQLPPNNVAMNIVLVRKSSRGAPISRPFFISLLVYSIALTLPKSILNLSSPEGFSISRPVLLRVLHRSRLYV